MAVKVQYPGVNNAVRADMQNLGHDPARHARVAPGLDAKAIAGEIRERIEEELDYELEAANQRSIGACSAATRSSSSPRSSPRCRASG